MIHRTLIEIDSDRIKENTALLKKRAGVSEFMAVVKADGYGHGAVEVARSAVQGGATWLGVATVEEGIELTVEGLNLPILVLSEPPMHASYVADMMYYELTPVVYTKEFIDLLPAGMEVHLKVDTGMHRVGVSVSEALTMVNYIEERSLKLTGLMTHYAAAERDKDLTFDQLMAFNEVVNSVGVDDGIIKHASNTFGVLYNSIPQWDMVRCGLGIYGLVGAEFGLRPALSFSSVLRNVRWFPAGTRLSYQQERMEQDGYIGVVPVGYADGIPRRAGGKAWVVVEGRQYPVVAVTMDIMLVDLGRTVIEPGAQVELVGPNISVNDWARWLDVIPYEFVCGLGKRVKRVWR